MEPRIVRSSRCYTGASVLHYWHTCTGGLCSPCVVMMCCSYVVNRGDTRGRIWYQKVAQFSWAFAMLSYTRFFLYKFLALNRTQNTHTQNSHAHDKNCEVDWLVLFLAGIICHVCGASFWYKFLVRDSCACVDHLLLALHRFDAIDWVIWVWL